MREIKFKGVDIADDKWIYGSLVKVGEDYHILGGGETEAHEYNIVYEESIGQYTGLKDKNGKEIYEGDILEFETGEIFKVYWWESECCCYIQSILEPYINISFEMYPMENFEIIGNIFENKELLDDY